MSPRQLWILVLLALASCQHLRTGTTLAAGDLSDSAVVLPVSIVSQDELFECGLASVSALTLFHGVVIPTEGRTRLTEIAEREEGISGAELRDTLEALGLEVFLFEGRLDDSVAGAFHHLDRGRPLLVMIPGGGRSLHYCLLTGYDPANETVILLDPSRGNLVLPQKLFDDLWEDAGRFTLLAIPPTPADQQKEQGNQA